MDTENDRNRQLELFKMEYEKAAERYENIYKAVWQNFSYMALVSGGILAFGADALSTSYLAGGLACLPLIFWYWATFVPMNIYGDRTGARLATIERILNELAGKSAGKVTEVKVDFKNRDGRISRWFGLMKRQNIEGQEIAIKHYDDFENRHPSNCDAKDRGQNKRKHPSVRNRVHSFVAIVFVAAVLLFCMHFKTVMEKDDTSRPLLWSEPFEVHVQEPMLKDIREELDSLAMQIQALEAIVSKNNTIDSLQ